MKKLTAAILVSVFLLSACGKMKTTDGLIRKARKEMHVSDAESMDIAFAGECKNDSYSLLWFISGDESQAHYYLPMECLNVNGEYEFRQTFEPISCGEDIAALQWQRGYSFLINSAKCKTLKITDTDGAHTIDINEYPFVWYNETMPSEYLFLDIDGNEIT